jgi:hypothetical protein
MARSHVLVPSTGTIKLATYQYTDGANIKDDELVALGEQHLPTYSVVGAPSTATANSHLVQIMAGASNRVRIRRIEYYLNTLATTAAFGVVSLFRLTTAGTGGGAVTPSAFDPADSGSGATAMTLPTVKGTEGAQIWTGAAYFMQTAGASTPLVQPILVWDFDRLHSKPITIAAGTTNGVAIKQETAIAGAIARISVIFDESPY